jgi:hypothetical protein
MKTFTIELPDEVQGLSVTFFRASKANCGISNAMFATPKENGKYSFQMIRGPDTNGNLTYNVQKKEGK